MVIMKINMASHSGGGARAGGVSTSEGRVWCEVVCEIF